MRSSSYNLKASEILSNNDSETYVYPIHRLFSLYQCAILQFSNFPEKEIPWDTAANMQGHGPLEHTYARSHTNCEQPRTICRFLWGPAQCLPVVHWVCDRTVNGLFGSWSHLPSLLDFIFILFFYPSLSFFCVVLTDLADYATQCTCVHTCMCCARIDQILRIKPKQLWMLWSVFGC